MVVENPLKLIDGHWERDWDGLEACFKDGVKVFFMCSPHNPVGRGMDPPGAGAPGGALRGL